MKWIKAIGAIALILAIIGVGVLATLPYRMGREIDLRIAAIKMKGDPVSGKDFISRVADSQNGALLYERVFKITEPGKEEIMKEYYSDGVMSPLKRQEHPELLALARRTATKYRAILPLIEQAAARPQCRFHANWNRPPELILFPYFSKIRNVSRLLSEIAVVDAADGRMGDSIRAVGLGYRLSESIREEPTLIGCLVRIACIAISSQGLKQSAQYGGISESQAHMLFDLLGKIDLQSGYVRAMKGERAQGLDIMERVRNHIIDINSDPATRPAGVRRTGIGAWLMDLRACADELFYMKYMDRVVDAAGQPYRNLISQQAEHEPNLPSYALISAVLLPIPISAKGKLNLFESMATVAGDNAFVAVLAYKAKFGNYPSDLSEVEVKLGWKLPLDPFVNDRFHYRREGKGFILYGLGRDMKDDNAKTVEDLPESIHPRDDRYTDFRDKYPYSNGDGRHSADMIWRINR